MREVFIPLDLASPTSDPVIIRQTIDWVRTDVIQHGDKVQLLTVVPMNTSSITEKISRAIVGAVELVSHDTVQPDITGVESTLVENTRHKLSQFAEYIQKCGNNVTVDYVVEKHSNPYVLIKEMLEEHKPDIIILYDRKQGQGKSILQEVAQAAQNLNIVVMQPPQIEC